MSENSKKSNFKIICILGYDRSGTTLIGKLYSKFEGVEYFGELDKTYQRLHDEHKRACSCGEDYFTCPVWKNIEIDKVKAEEDFYHQLIEVSNANYLIDSSKSIDHLKAIQDQFGEKVQFIHIIRNPKGVVYSRMKTRKRRVAKGIHPKMNIAKRTNMMMIYDALEWSLRNLRIELFKMKNSSFTTIIYEDLDKSFNKLVAKSLGEDKDISLLHQKDEKINHHVLYGNINRYKPVNLPIRIDYSWKEGLKGYQKLIVDFLTFPIRMVFNYKF